MALTELWSSSPEQLRDKHVQQIIAFAGSGKLRDGAPTSQEFRDFLSQVPSSFIARYINNCVSEGFHDSGLALQDVVNQVGRRLGYSVTHGLYRGRSGEIGFDGLWKAPDGHCIVIEVKTTDAYRIDLNTLAGYRQKLIEQNTATSGASSILIVVGRQDTGDLEAQIRGSRYAWDIRLISVDALVRLMHLKEEIEEPRILKKIGDILIPKEYTKLDEIIDMVFSTAEDIRYEDIVEQDDESNEELPVSDTKAEMVGPKFKPVEFNDECIARVQDHLGLSLIKQSRTTYMSDKGETVVVCAVSKTYAKQARREYWFAFHPHQSETLSTAKNAYVAFGCGSAEQILFIPFAQFKKWLDGLNQTVREDRSYWHVSIVQKNGEFILRHRKNLENIELQSYLI